METAPKYNMLIVDDTKMNRTILQRIFRDKYRLICAENGLEAMNVLRTEKIDMMLLDILMPEMDGFEVIAAVKGDETLCGIPIIVMTSERDKAERKALEMGADDFIYKPYDSVVVEKRVANITRMHILEREKMERLLLEQEMRARTMEKLAVTDPLTQIPNRMGFRRGADHLLDRASAAVALMVIDIDNFKFVNDKYGHPKGDELLVALASFLESSAMQGDIVGRLGGDEFAVCMAKPVSRGNAMEKANAFIKNAARIRRELGFTEGEAVSIGIAYAAEPGCGLKQLYEVADNALYYAKDQGKSRAALMDVEDGTIKGIDMR